MPKVWPIQTNFTAGQLSARLHGRVDVNKYNNGLKTQKNAYSLPHGGVVRRGGFRHVAGVKTNSSKVRLVRFEFSITQAYIIEFGNQYIRFYKDNGQILTGGSPVEVATPFTEAQLFDLYFAQSADTLYIAHPSHSPRSLTRSSDINWTLATLSFTSAPSDFVAGAGDYPRCVTFFEERLYWAGTNNKPQTIWASKSGDFLNMNQGTGLDDESLSFTLATDDVNVIRWMKASDVLLVGTVGGEFKLQGGGNPVTPSNVRVVQETKYGSSTVTPITSGRAVLFNQRASKKIRQMIFDLNVEGFVAPDLTILAEDITGDGITHMAYQQEPDSIVWCVREDGVLLGLTYQRDQQVVAWHQHPLGGTNAEVESVAVIPSADGKSDELWASIKRTVNSSVVRYVEYLDQTIFVDSGLKYSGSATSTLSGLTHLEGETVQVLGDGAVMPDVVVSSGSITLGQNVTSASVGLKYTTEIVTLPPEVPQADGASFGKKKSWNRIILNLFETLGLSVNNNQLIFRTGGDPMDSAPPLFTGQFDITNLGWKEADSSITIKQEQPLGMTLISLAGELSVND